MTRRIDNTAKQLEVFHTWLMSATSNHESYRKRRVNAQLRDMLHRHRRLSLTRRVKAAFW